MGRNEVYIFRKSNAKIVVESKDLLTNNRVNELPHGNNFSLFGYNKPKIMPHLYDFHKKTI